MTDTQRRDVYEVHSPSLLSAAPVYRPRESAVVYMIGGRRYPLKTIRQCHTCTSHHRLKIERALLRGLSYAGSLKGLPEGHGVSRESVRTHVQRQHLPADQALYRAIIEDRAEEIGRDLDEAQGSIADYITFAKQGIQRTFERMADGQVEPTISEAIALSRLLMDVEERVGGDVDSQVYAEGFRIYVETAREVMTPDQFRLFGARLTAHPIMQSLLGKKPIEARASEAS